MLRIGIDFDNTIVDYRPVFLAAMPDAALSKAGIRDTLRALPDGEAAWQRLQAHAYGTGIAQAPAFEGLDSFLQMARQRGARLYIVSHKSRFAAAAPQGPDLREAAHAWLASRKIEVDGVFFESTRKEKLARIQVLDLTHFIDDLEDVLTDAAFPNTTRPIHFRDSWETVQRDVFG